jgi:putative endonuclease
MLLLPEKYCYVYIVRCSDGSLYTGITRNLEKRIQRHNGLLWGGAKYTRSRRPVEYVYIEKYPTRKEAAQREYFIKHHMTKEEKERLSIR